MPRLNEALELRGAPCLASLPGTWSMPRKKLKPVMCTLAIQPKEVPNVPAARLTPAEKHLTGCTLAERRISGVKLTQEVVDPDDIEMLQDLIVAAVNEALKQADEANEALMGKMTGGLGGFPF